MARNLSSFDSGLFPDMLQSIEHYKQNPINIDNTSSLIIKNGIAFKDFFTVFERYQDAISKTLISIKFENRWTYKPKLISKELYGTTDLFYIIMMVNKIASLFQFKDMTTIKVINPSKLDILAEIINSHEDEINSVYLILDDMTLRKV